MAIRQVLKIYTCYPSPVWVEYLGFDHRLSTSGQFEYSIDYTSTDVGIYSDWHSETIYVVFRTLA